MNHLKQALGELRDAHLLRRRSTCEAINATHVLYNDQPCLLLAGNSYLGLTHHPAVQNAAAAAALQYGTGSGGSRLTTGSHALYESLEAQLAAFKHSEDALVFSSGYAANVGVLSALGRKEDVFFSAALNHASLIEWLNPDYQRPVTGARKARLACVQYQMRKVKSFADFERQVTYFVEVAADYRDWLRGHMAEILALPGFLGAELCEVLDPAPADGSVGLCVQYRLADEAALAAYVRDHAPRLRAEG